MRQLLLSLITVLIFSNSLFADEKKSLADELPRIKATEPKDALKTFKVLKGFQLQMVAAEPLVSDPVDACFDADGRMYVAEMHGYPFSEETTRYNPQGGGKKDAGIIRLLEDVDGDGKFERSVKFADGITWPTSVCCYDGGVFVLAPPTIHYFKDTNGDDVADVHEEIFTGFGRDNVQGLANNMKWMLNNRIALAAGRNPTKLTRHGNQVATLGRSDMSFNPQTFAVQLMTGGIQFGHSADNFGNRFVCSNSNHIQHIVFPYQYTKRNPFYSTSGSIRSIAKNGAAAPVFRRSPAEPWRIVRTRRRVSDPKMKARLPRTEQFAIGFFTSATGVTIYRGSAYPKEFHGNAFVGDVGGNLVHRKTMAANGASFLATRADEGAEFIASTDNWFRPTNFVNAPDGSLLILDMYRETIEHPYSIPADIKEHLDLESGHDRGRIYRLVPSNWKQPKVRKLANAANSVLVAELESPNSWNRETAQRLLVERKAQSVFGELTNIVQHSKSATAKVHALWTLHGLGLLTEEIVIAGLQSDDPRVQEQAIRLVEELKDAGKATFKELRKLVDSKDDRLRFQLAFTVGEFNDTAAAEIIADMIRNPVNTGDVYSALMTSVARHLPTLSKELLNDSDFINSNNSLRLKDVVTMIGMQPNDKLTETTLQTLAANFGSATNRLRLIQSLGTGLRRRGLTIPGFASKLPANSPSRKLITAMFAGSIQVAGDDSKSNAERVQAISFLKEASFEIAAEPLAALVTPQTPQSLQHAAVDALSAHNSARVANILIDAWPNLSPSLRSSAADVLLRSTARINALLKAIESNRVQKSELSRDKIALLVNSTNADIKTRAAKLFAANSNRQEVIQKYQSALDLQGNIERGRMAFTKTCSVCHQVGKVGHQVAPNLASVQNKSPADLVVAILDPNRELQPNFINYNVETEQGQVVTGIIVAESANSLTLRRAEGKESVVARKDIIELKSSGKSLMPEGFEKDISPQQLADIIAFIKTIQPEPKK